MASPTLTFLPFIPFWWSYFYASSSDLFDKGTILPCFLLGKQDCTFLCTPCPIFTSTSKYNSLHHEDVGSKVLQNVGILLHHYMASKHRRPWHESSLWKPQISQCQISFCFQKWILNSTQVFTNDAIQWILTDIYHKWIFEQIIYGCYFVQFTLNYVMNFEVLKSYSYKF